MSLRVMSTGSMAADTGPEILASASTKAAILAPSRYHQVVARRLVCQIALRQERNIALRDGNQHAPAPG
jgi:hypothetical protein